MPIFAGTGTPSAAGVGRGEDGREADGEGFDGTPVLPGEIRISEKGGAESGAVSSKTAPIDPDLARIIDAWPTLPETTRVAIVRAIQAG